ncbi:hypothetical protein TYRP_000543 [Tyrophagus putrescentiae]|nr:hypothetical protein TYRP_000543 [Tyrophagus putrescentiae]
MNSTSSAFRQSSNTWGSSVKGSSSANSKGSSGLFGSTKSSSGAFGSKSAKCDNCNENGKCLKSFTKQPCEKKYDW